MVAWVPDRSGRFPKRPHYTQQELDRECEAMVGHFLHEKYGRIEYPLTTNDLTILVESFCSDVDQYADLSAEGPDVEGMTEFFPDAAPKIYISDGIAADERRENRLRTTLAHELGHAHFHRRLFAELFAPGALFSCHPSEAKMVCKRDNMLGAKEVDWMEWQAGYASGAFLMPASALRRHLSTFCSTRGLHTVIPVESADSLDMQRAVMNRFQVSSDAARVRLLKLGFLTNQPGPPSLFG